MIKRTPHFSIPAYLKVKEEQLRFENVGTKEIKYKSSYYTVNTLYYN